jgi:hypothetical protein
MAQKPKKKKTNRPVPQRQGLTDAQKSDLPKCPCCNMIGPQIQWKQNRVGTTTGMTTFSCVKCRHIISVQFGPMPAPKQSDIALFNASGGILKMRDQLKPLENE